jgi:NAD-dependent dihydropyrimidine dehydrogenase PreA subunit
MINKFKLNKIENCGQCNLCVELCEKIGIGVITKVDGAILKKVPIQNGRAFRECIGCAICVNVCPRNAIKLIEKNDGIEIWGKKFKLVQCQDCGRYYASEEHVKYIYNRAGIKLDKLRCEKCKRKSSTKDMKNILYGIRTL